MNGQVSILSDGVKTTIAIDGKELDYVTYMEIRQQAGGVAEVTLTLDGVALNLGLDADCIITATGVDPEEIVGRAS